VGQFGRETIYIDLYILLLEWLGYSGPKEAQKQAFLLKQSRLENSKLREQLEDKNNHVLLLKDLLIDDTKREKLQVVYISTSQNYARQNRSKPGGVEKEALLRSRLSTYNSRSAKGDEWYFVADYRQVESRLKDVLGRFQEEQGDVCFKPLSYDLHRSIYLRTLQRRSG
jgi:hypothetical protein